MSVAWRSRATLAADGAAGASDGTADAATDAVAEATTSPTSRLSVSAPTIRTAEASVSLPRPGGVVMAVSYSVVFGVYPSEPERYDDEDDGLVVLSVQDASGARPRRRLIDRLFGGAR